MSNKFAEYRVAANPLPSTTLVWNMYGPGLENVGQDGQPEQLAIPEPGADEILVRIDSVGMCFSDVKLIRQGGSHPKLYNRDLSVEPTRLGHEVSLTVIKVGANLADTFQPGQRLAVQPDVYQNGMSTAYGYTVPGGLIQYHLMGKELMETDAGICLLPLADELGYAESALLEPWGCVMAAYTQRRRLDPKKDGTMWIIGNPEDDRTYEFSQGLDKPATIILTDVNESIQALVANSSAEIVQANGLAVEDYASFVAGIGDGKGIDDIVVLEPRSGATVSEIARQIARRGTMNLVGTQPLDSLSDSDVGRLHYDYIAFIGTNGDDIAASYGEARNRCELASNGATVVIGAGGPMGQMHVQRALELPDGPKLVIATEINSERLDAIQDRLGPLAEGNGRTLLTFNPLAGETTLKQFVTEATDGKMADDVVVSVPSARLMEEAAETMNENGMLVLFAGVPNGTMAPLNLTDVYLANAQYTGTSGLTIHDQADVMARTVAGSLSPGQAVAAIGGMNVAKEALQAMMDSRYPGKIVIFPQLPDLPLFGLDELAEKLPAVGKHLGPGNSWTQAAEEALLGLAWQ